jgi:hypothetical protein
MIKFVKEPIDIAIPLANLTDTKRKVTTNDMLVVEYGSKEIAYVVEKVHGPKVDLVDSENQKHYIYGKYLSDMTNQKYSLVAEVFPIEDQTLDLESASNKKLMETCSIINVEVPLDHIEKRKITLRPGMQVYSSLRSKWYTILTLTEPTLYMTLQVRDENGNTERMYRTALGLYSKVRLRAVLL